MKIGLFYGSTTCYTEMAAEKIQQTLGEELVSIHNIKDQGFDGLEDFAVLIFGISTWDFGEIQEDWEAQWQDVAELNLEGKVIALYGMGDQQGYGEWFQDALGMLHDLIQDKGCTLVGYWPNSGYEFINSKALTEDKTQFVGLALDDECQYDLSDERIQTWTDQLLDEIPAAL